MNKKTYVLCGIDTAISLLRPKAKYCIVNTEILWDDPRPAPTWEEITNTLKKIKQFEDSIESIDLL